MSRFRIGDSVKVRDRKGKLTFGTISKVFEDQWWGNTDYEVVYYSPRDSEGVIRITEQVLLRHNAKDKKEHVPDSLTKAKRRKRISAIKKEILEWETILDCDLKGDRSEDIRKDRHTIQCLKNELHCLFRKEEYRERTEKVSVDETFGLGLL